MHNGTATNISSMYRYFQEASNSAMLIPSTFYPEHNGNIITSYQDIHPRAYFQPYNAVTNPTGYTSSQEDQRAHQLWRRAVEAVRDQIPTTLNLDFNNDGRVDNVTFIVRGSPGGWLDLLWPHRYVLYTQNVTINGKRVYDYNVQIETHLDIYGAAVLTHELYHTLGAPDFYRYYNETIVPVGAWDLMATAGTRPQTTTAWAKHKYGKWINSIPVITQSGTYTLNNVWSPTNNAYRINSPNSTTEFFIVEYRNNSVFWDLNTPGSGLIIYRVNSTLTGNAQGPPDEVYIFRPGGTNTTTNGNINNAHFSSQVGRTTFNNTSNPPCFLSNNQPGGIHIRNIGASGGATMSFEVVMSSSSYTISASVSGGNGTINPSGSISVNHGGSQSFTFTPNSGYHISQVLINGVNNPAAVAAGSYIFTNVTANQTIVASFSNVYTITASVNGGNGTINPNGNITVNHGGNQSFAFTPNTGYRIAQVLVNGTNNTAAVAAGSYTFTNVAANHTIAVSFVGISSILTSIKVNDNAINSANNMTYMAACGEEYIDLELVSEGAIKINNIPYTGGIATTTLVFIDDKAIININIQGLTSSTYILSVSKALGGSSPRMYVQRWGKALAVINNPDNNGGHSFSNYQWYHNNAIMHGSTGGYILLGEDTSAHQYTTEANSSKTGLRHKICPNDSYATRTEMAVYPNPVGAGQLLNLSLPDGIDKVNIRIYNLSGNLVRQQDGVVHAVTMPNQTGVYILEIQLPDGTKNIQQVVVN